VIQTFPDRLTRAQKNALELFEPGKPRKAFPDINPRTATALWSMGLLRGELIDGCRIFTLTRDGELARQTLSLAK
jgi:hypothetical protein